MIPERPMHCHGFLVWCPERGYPSYTHMTFQSALAEAERLKAANPGHRFLIMAPVTDEASATYAMGYSRGKQIAEQQAHMEIMRAEGNADRAMEEAHELRKLKPILANVRRFQSLVADCLCWFSGYSAGRAGSDYGKPWMPSTDGLQDLNNYLQNALPDDLDSEIPF